MIFSSLAYFVFLLSILCLLIWARSNNSQKRIYLAGSYIFYMWYNPVFIILIIICTVFNYISGIYLDPFKNKANRKLWFILTLAANLGILAGFKYSGLLEEYLFYFFRLLGYQPTWLSLQIIMPLGISFFTLQLIGYIIDVYKNRINPTYSILDFALFVSFFPHISSGPIARANELLPQFQKARTLQFSINSFLLIFIGLFKKVVLADNIGSFTDVVFSQPSEFPSIIMWIAAIGFTVQIYCDFSGYTDIAIGTARLLGFNYQSNFNNPYFSISPSDFWRRWHMTLSRWFRDYVFLPLAYLISGRLVKPFYFKIKTELIIYVAGIMVTFLLTGLWHGGSFNFIIWGGYYGLLLSLYKILKLDKWIKSNPINRFAGWALMVLLTIIAWTIFRNENISNMTLCLHKLFYFDYNFSLSGIGLGSMMFFSTVLLILLFIVSQMITYFYGNIETILGDLNPIALSFVLLISTMMLYFFIPENNSSFIYVQF